MHSYVQLLCDLMIHEYFLVWQDRGFVIMVTANRDQAFLAGSHA
jgi:hypothetical protein